MKPECWDQGHSWNATVAVVEGRCECTRCGIQRYANADGSFTYEDPTDVEYRQVVIFA